MTNYVSFTPGPVQIDQYTGDVLQQLGQNDSLHGFYAFQKDVRTEPALQGDTLPGWGDHRAAHRQIGTLQYVHIFNSNVTNEARIGVQPDFDCVQSGEPDRPGKHWDQRRTDWQCGHSADDDHGRRASRWAGRRGSRRDADTTTGVLSDTVTMLKGKHQIKWGGEFRRYLLYSFAGNIGSMSLSSANLANDVTPVFSIQPNIIDYRIYADAAAGFIQDNYRMLPGLTLEGGLRFEWNGTPVEGENRISIFNPANITLTQAGTNGVPANGAYKQNYNLEPRVGFAYDVFKNNKTVVARRVRHAGRSAGSWHGKHPDGESTVYYGGFLQQQRRANSYEQPVCFGEGCFWICAGMGESELTQCVRGGLQLQCAAGDCRGAWWRALATTVLPGTIC